MTVHLFLEKKNEHTAEKEKTDYHGLHKAQVTYQQMKHPLPPVR